MDRPVFLSLVLFAATVLFVYAFGLLLSPFFVPIAWAMALGAVTTRPYRSLVKKWRKPRLAAFVLVALTAVVVLVPLLLIVTLTLREMAALSTVNFDDWREELKTSAPRAYEAVSGLVAQLGGDIEHFDAESLKTVPQKVWGGLAAGAGALVFGALQFLVMFVVMLATMYVLYLQTPRLRSLIVDLSPLETSSTDRILETLRSTTVAAVLGGMLLALMQGVLGGLTFLIGGLSSPALWGMAMAFASFVPIVGSAIVWGPAAAYLFLTGHPGSGWFVLITGALIAIIGDNVVRPMLLRRGGADSIHPLLLFFAILSGVGLFGISGVVFGPMLIALLVTMASIYRDYWPHETADPCPPAT